jgi:hypothetical protein
MPRCKQVGGASRHLSADIGFRPPMAMNDCPLAAIRPLSVTGEQTFASGAYRHFVDGAAPAFATRWPRCTGRAISEGRGSPRAEAGCMKIARHKLLIHHRRIESGISPDCGGEISNATAQLREGRERHRSHSVRSGPSGTGSS